MFENIELDKLVICPKCNSTLIYGTAKGKGSFDPTDEWKSSQFSFTRFNRGILKLYFPAAPMGTSMLMPLEIECDSCFHELKSKKFVVIHEGIYIGISDSVADAENLKKEISKEKLLFMYYSLFKKFDSQFYNTYLMKTFIQDVFSKRNKKEKNLNLENILKNFLDEENLKNNLNELKNKNKTFI